MNGKRMNHLLACLAEECGEVVQETCKALRWGLDNYHPKKKLTNFERIKAELHDVYAIVCMIEEEEGRFGFSKYDYEVVQEKIDKVEKYMKEYEIE